MTIKRMFSHLLFLAVACACLAGRATAQRARVTTVRRVLLISVDGFHAIDLANCVAAGTCPNLAQLSSTGVTANCLHPGFVNTRFGDRSKGALSLLLRVAKKFALSPEKGAETIVFLASAKEVAGSTGEYFYQCQPKIASIEALSDDDAERLWEESARLAR